MTTANRAPTDEKLYTTSIPTATDAGTYYIWYKVEGDANHNSTEPIKIEVKIAEQTQGSNASGDVKAEGDVEVSKTDGLKNSLDTLAHAELAKEREKDSDVTKVEVILQATEKDEESLTAQEKTELAKVKAEAQSDTHKQLELLDFSITKRVTTGSGRFEPNTATSRAMIVTMLWRMEGEPRTSATLTFTDVPEDTWYTEAVRWASSEGIVNGYSADTKIENE